jgi:WD40 repeat protein
LLASADLRGGFIVRDVATGRELLSVKTGQEDTFPPAWVFGLHDNIRPVFAPDGTSLFAVTPEQFVRQWNLATRQPVRAWEREIRVTTLALAPDGRLLALGYADGSIRTWDVATGQEVRRMVGHKRKVDLLAFARNGQTLTSVGGDGFLVVWDVASGKEMQRVPGLPEKEASFAIAPDEKTLAFAGREGSLRVIDARTGQSVLSPGGHTATVLTAAFSPDGKTVASGSRDRTVRLWDPRSGREVRQFGKLRSEVRGVSFSPDGKTLAAGGEDVHVWEVGTGKELHKFEDCNTDFLTFAEGNTLVLGNSYLEKIDRVWLDGRKPVVLQAGPWGFPKPPFVSAALANPSPVPVAVSSDGRRAVSRYFSWDLRAGHEVPRQENPGWEMDTHFAFAPNGKLLIGTTRRRARIVEFSTGQTVARIETVGGWCVFAPDGRTLATPGPDQTLRLIDVPTGKERQLVGHQGWICAVSFSPYGTLLATASGDHTVLIWDLSEKRVPVRHSTETLRQLWADLDHTDPARAYRAIWSLADAAEQSPTFLRDCIQPSLERLEKAEDPSARRRLLRVVETLEMIGTQESRRELQRLAEEAQVKWLKQEAEAALVRLKGRLAP